MMWDINDSGRGMVRSIIVDKIHRAGW